MFILSKLLLNCEKIESLVGMELLLLLLLPPVLHTLLFIMRHTVRTLCRVSHLLPADCVISASVIPMDRVIDRQATGERLWHENPGHYSVRAPPLLIPSLLSLFLRISRANYFNSTGAFFRQNK